MTGRDTATLAAAVATAVTYTIAHSVPAATIATGGCCTTPAGATSSPATSSTAASPTTFG